MAKSIVKFNEDKCKGCELCISFCPTKIIQLHPTRINSKGYHPAYIPEESVEKCVGCISCGMMCPDGAVNVYREE